MSEQSAIERQPLGLTELVLRDGQQSLLATRLRLDDMLPVAAQLDSVGYWSMESWGGATFDAGLRFLGEDPWLRIRELKAAMPNTRQQMLLRGQNLLGYRHYADDVVRRFVACAATAGVDVFRVFDALNDPRNLATAIDAVIAEDRHAQGALSYTISPVHTLAGWVDLARRIEDMGAHSVAIKDMAGLLSPYAASELVSALRMAVSVPIHMQCHATTGFSVATILMAVEAGLSNVDCSISSLSMSYGHAPTETVISMFQGHGRDTGLALEALEPIAAHFRTVRRRYAAFEGELRGVDARILSAQVPGGMLSNLEQQLREQRALDRFDEVLQEIPRVREDLGFLPLVTPTSQIVGTQAVLNVLHGERYQTMARETTAILRGEYGNTPAPVNKQLRERALREAGEAVELDHSTPEMGSLLERLLERGSALDLHFDSGEPKEEELLSYAMFPEVALKFFQHRGDASAFEQAPGAEPAAMATSPETGAENGASEVRAVGANQYQVTVDGQHFRVQVQPDEADAEDSQAVTTRGDGTVVAAPMAGTVLRVIADEGDVVAAGEVLLVMEAMKMETEVRALQGGVLRRFLVSTGDAVSVGDALVEIG